jgi:dolichyl-phosphate-mannose--protein O-mannosyl transferase
VPIRVTRKSRDKINSLLIFILPFFCSYIFVSAIALHSMKHPSYATPLSDAHLFVTNYHFWDLIPLQALMFYKNLSVKFIHDFSSPWWSWPILRTPIWYFAQMEKMEQGPIFFQGVVYLGNPVIAWSGLISVIVCLFLVLRRKRELLIPLATYAAIWAAGITMAGRTGYYFYYFGSEMLLPIFIVAVFRELGWKFGRKKIEKYFYSYIVLCVFVFFLFYPLLTGRPIPAQALRYRSWLPSWTLLLQENAEAPPSLPLDFRSE